MRNETSVERVIREMQESREQYKRDEYKKAAKKIFLTAAPAKVQGYLEEQKLELDELSPRRAKSNPVLQDRINMLAADPSISASAMKSEAVKIVDSLRKKIVTQSDDLLSAFEEAKTELRRQADPFKDHDTALQRFMAEVQLTGGFPKTKEKLAKRVEADIGGHDEGAIAFWAKNFQTTFGNASDANLSLDRAAELGEKIDGKIKDMVSKRRDASQNQAVLKLSELESAWRTADLSKQFLVVDSYLRDEPADQIMAPTPREKTELERRQAEAHAANKRAVAMAEEAREYARSLQAKVDEATVQIRGKQR